MHCRKETDFFPSRKSEVKGARLCDRGGPSPHLNWTANVNYTRNEVSMNAHYFSPHTIDQISSQVKGRREMGRGRGRENSKTLSLKDYSFRFIQTCLITSPC